MVYQPSKKEIKQIEKLNKAYKLIQEGIKLIRENTPKKDSEVEMQVYKIGKNFDKIIKRIYKIMETQHIDAEFIDIITKRATKDKPNRFKKNNKKSNKFKKTKKRFTKGKK